MTLDPFDETDRPPPIPSLAFGEVVVEAVVLLLRSAPVMVPLYALCALPVIATMWLAETPPNPGLVLPFLVGFPLIGWLWAAHLRILLSLRRGQTCSLRQAASFALNRTGAILGSAIMVSLVMLLTCVALALSGSLVLIGLLVGAFLTTSIFMYFQVAVLGCDGFAAALFTSHQLAGLRRSSLFILQLVSGLLAVGFYALGGRQVFEFLTLTRVVDTHPWVSAGLVAWLLALLSSFNLTVGFVAYWRLTRGLDLAWDLGPTRPEELEGENVTAL